MKRFNYKLLTSIALLVFTHPSLAKDLQQQKDIDALVKEMTYIIQVTKKLKHKYREDNSKIRFNYDALIEQLTVAREATKEYLNHELYELHSAPPVPIIRNQTKVKP